MDSNRIELEPPSILSNEDDIVLNILNANGSREQSPVLNRVSNESGIASIPHASDNGDSLNVDDADSCLVRCEFRDSKTFDALHTVISQCIRDTLFSLKKSTSVVLNRDENVVQILEIFGESTDESMFMVDTLPTKCMKESEIPNYDTKDADILHDNNTRSENSNEISNPTEVRSTGNCWNCGGNHCLIDCKEPHRPEIISRNKQLFVQKTKTERYHLESDQRFGCFMPGTISDALRDALGLRSRELPLYIYKMRLYGYPPGWIEDAKISNSGIAVLDANVSIPHLLVFY